MGKSSLLSGYVFGGMTHTLVLGTSEIENPLKFCLNSALLNHFFSFSFSMPRHANPLFIQPTFFLFFLSFFPSSTSSSFIDSFSSTFG